MESLLTFSLFVALMGLLFLWLTEKPRKKYLSGVVILIGVMGLVISGVGLKDERNKLENEIGAPISFSQLTEGTEYQFGRRIEKPDYTIINERGLRLPRIIYDFPSVDLKGGDRFIIKEKKIIKLTILRETEKKPSP